MVARRGLPALTNVVLLLHLFHRSEASHSKSLRRRDDVDMPAVELGSDSGPGDVQIGQLTDSIRSLFSLGGAASPPSNSSGPSVAALPSLATSLSPQKVALAADTASTQAASTSLAAAAAASSTSAAPLAATTSTKEEEVWGKNATESRNHSWFSAPEPAKVAPAKATTTAAPLATTAAAAATSPAHAVVTAPAKTLTATVAPPAATVLPVAAAGIAPAAAAAPVVSPAVAAVAAVRSANATTNASAPAAANATKVAEKEKEVEELPFAKMLLGDDSDGSKASTTPTANVSSNTSAPIVLKTSASNASIPPPVSIADKASMDTNKSDKKAEAAIAKQAKAAAKAAKAAEAKAARLEAEVAALKSKLAKDEQTIKTKGTETPTSPPPQVVIVVPQASTVANATVVRGANGTQVSMSLNGTTQAISISATEQSKQTGVAAKPTPSPKSTNGTAGKAQKAADQLAAAETAPRTALLDEESHPAQGKHSAHAKHQGHEKHHAKHPQSTNENKVVHKTGHHHHPASTTHAAPVSHEAASLPESVSKPEQEGYHHAAASTTPHASKAEVAKETQAPPAAHHAFKKFGAPHAKEHTAHPAQKPVAHPAAKPAAAKLAAKPAHKAAVAATSSAAPAQHVHGAAVAATTAPAQPVHKVAVTTSALAQPVQKATVAVTTSVPAQPARKAAVVATTSAPAVEATPAAAAVAATTAVLAATTAAPVAVVATTSAVPAAAATTAAAAAATAAVAAVTTAPVAAVTTAAAVKTAIAQAVATTSAQALKAPALAKTTAAAAAPTTTFAAAVVKTTSHAATKVAKHKHSTTQVKLHLPMPSIYGSHMRSLQAPLVLPAADRTSTPASTTAAAHVAHTTAAQVTTKAAAHAQVTTTAAHVKVTTKAAAHTKAAATTSHVHKVAVKTTTMASDPLPELGDTFGVPEETPGKTSLHNQDSQVVQATVRSAHPAAPKPAAAPHSPLHEAHAAASTPQKAQKTFNSSAVEHLQPHKVVHVPLASKAPTKPVQKRPMSHSKQPDPKLRIHGGFPKHRKKQSLETDSATLSKLSESPPPQQHQLHSVFDDVQRFAGKSAGGMSALDTAGDGLVSFPAATGKRPQAAEPLLTEALLAAKPPQRAPTTAAPAARATPAPVAAIAKKAPATTKAPAAVEAATAAPTARLLAHAADVHRSLGTPAMFSAPEAPSRSTRSDAPQADDDSRIHFPPLPATWEQSGALEGSQAAVAPAETAPAVPVTTAAPQDASTGGWLHSLFSWLWHAPAAPTQAVARKPTPKTALLPVKKTRPSAQTMLRWHTNFAAMDDRQRDISIADAFGRAEQQDEQEVERLQHQDFVERAATKPTEKEVLQIKKSPRAASTHISNFWKTLETEDNDMAVSLEQDKDLTKYEKLVHLQDSQVKDAAVELERPRVQSNKRTHWTHRQADSQQLQFTDTAFHETFGKMEANDKEIEAKIHASPDLQMMQVKELHKKTTAGKLRVIKQNA